MSVISPISCVSFCGQGFAPTKRQPVTYADIAQRERERAVIIAKQKTDSERNFSDYLLLASDSLQKIINSPVVYCTNGQNGLHYVA